MYNESATRISVSTTWRSLPANVAAVAASTASAAAIAAAAASAATIAAITEAALALAPAIRAPGKPR
jgi:hypothetical protein